MSESLELTRINSDGNGNPRVVVHFLALNTREELDKTGADWVEIGEKYRLALARAKTIGGRKFHNRQFGGGIAFVSFNHADLAAHISRVTGRQFTSEN